MTSLVLLEKTSKLDNVSLQQIFNRVPLLKYRHRGFFPLTMFQRLTMTLLPLLIRNPALCRVSIGE